MKKSLPVLIITVLTLLLFSCSLDVMDKGQSVNEYIFPYVKFTLSDDGTYYTASIPAGAAVDRIYIPSYVDDGSSSIPVKYFAGFEKDEDVVNLKSTTFESSITEIRLNSLNQASILSTITFDSTADGYKLWENLPQLEHSADKEFIGWFLVDSPEVQICDGDEMEDSGFTRMALFAKWGTHNLVSKEGKAATCTTAGYEAYQRCDNELVDTTTGVRGKCSYTTKVEIPALGHDIVLKYEKRDATCSTDGYRVDIWQCTRCSAYFSDSDGKKEINLEDVVLSHDGVEHVSDKTYHWDETNHWYECVNCGAHLEEESHDIVEEKRLDCLYAKCTKCGYEAETPLDDKWDLVPKVEPKCETAGKESYYRCLNHGWHFTLSLDPIVLIDKKTLDKETYIEPLEHKFPEGEYEKDEDGHWQACSHPGCTATTKKEEHNYEYTFVVDKEKREVSAKRRCIVCGYDGTSSSTPGESAFDISATFGKISVEKKYTNTWTLSYYGEGESFYWTDGNGNSLVEGKEPFTITYEAKGEGSFLVFCNSYNRKGELINISFVMLTGY